MKSRWMSLSKRNLNMKVAYVHDWLIFPGWAEKVFFDMIEWKMKEVWNIQKFQRRYWKENIEEKIFTNFHNLDFINPTNIEIESVKSNKNIWKYYRNFMPIFPYFTAKLSKKIEKFNPDIVVISSFAIAKNINIKAKKILYLHSPMQYIWSHYDEYLQKFSWLKKLIYRISSKYLRIWDKRYSEFDEIYFNSNYSKRLFSQIYKQKWGKVVHPIVEKPEKFENLDIQKKYNISWDYFLYIGRTVRLVKQLDKIIESFNKNKQKLVIVWDGPDREYLQKIANKNIIFLWYIDSKSQDYWQILKNAKALINITKESFGIVNFQASLVETPIISMNHGAIDDIPWKKYFIEELKDIDDLLKKI